MLLMGRSHEKRRDNAGIGGTRMSDLKSRQATIDVPDK
jgi:hypothetical protein